MPNWEVRLAISGAISIEQPLTLQAEKGYAPFMTTVKLTKARHGIEVRLIAKAIDSEQADEVAIYFVGQMLDVMCLYLDTPLYLSLDKSDFRPVDASVKRIILREEWEDAFKRGRDYGINRPIFSRALSWYRKGLTSQDVMDRLFALWLSIEIVGTKYARENERTIGAGKTKNKILDCFDQLWENKEEWKVVRDEPSWVDGVHQLRNEIAHGVLPVELETIKIVLQKVPKLRRLAAAFLRDWESNGSDL